MNNTSSTHHSAHLSLDGAHHFYRSHRVDETRALLFKIALREESENNHRFPSLNQWDAPLVEHRYDVRPYLRSLGENGGQWSVEKAEEKSPRGVRGVPLRRKYAKMATEEEKPRFLGDDLHTQELRSLSTSEKKLREALGDIAVQRDGIAKKKNSFSVRDQKNQSAHQKFRKFNPSKRVLVGQQKLRNTLPRAQSAQALLQSVTSISALTRRQNEPECDSEPPMLEVQTHNSKQRCREGLQYLYRYVSSMRKIENKLPHIVESECSKVSEESDHSTADSSFDESRLELLEKEEDKIKLMDTQKSTNSDFSPTYYRHLSSLLSEIEDASSPQRAGSTNKLPVRVPRLDLTRCKRRERSPSADCKTYQKWYKAQEEVEASESLILGYTFKLKKCKQC